MDKSISDASKLSEYVVAGAQLKCSFGATPSTLMMPMSHGMFLNGKVQCNVMDSKPIMNILPFGVCKMPYPAPTCLPMTATPWVNNFGTNLCVGSQRALIKNANLFCARGGIITIEQSGQMSVLDILLAMGDNKEIMENMQHLYDLAKEYNPNASERELAEMVLQVMRQNKYDGGNWDVVSGEVDDSFVTYVQNNAKDTYDFFQKDEIYFTDLAGNKIDLPHFAATLNAHIYSSDWTNFGATMAGESAINQLSGWAGDYQTFMKEVLGATNNSNDYQTVYDEARRRFGQTDSTFSWEDLYADTDAYNMGKLINQDSSIMDTMYAYYTDGYSTRFQNFTNNQSKNDIRGIVGTFSSKTMILPFSLFGANEWPLLKGVEYRGEFERAMADSFTDIIYEQVTLEKEGQ